MGRLSSRARDRRRPSSRSPWRLAPRPAGRREPGSSSAVRALRSRVRAGVPAAGGRPADRRPARPLPQGAPRGRGATPTPTPRGALGVDPAEFAWIRARIVEALAGARRAPGRRIGVCESYARGDRAAARGAPSPPRDPKTAARIDAEIAALERERAALRRPDAAGPRPSRKRGACRGAPRRRSRLSARDAARSASSPTRSRRARFRGRCALVGSGESVLARRRRGPRRRRAGRGRGDSRTRSSTWRA